MEKQLLTVDEAINLLPKGNQVHTFRNPGGMLVGCDWDKKTVISALRDANGIELGGETSMRMNHAIIIVNNGSYLFIENDAEKIKKYA